MTDNKMLTLIEHFLYSCNVVGIPRNMFTLNLGDETFTVSITSARALRVLDLHETNFLIKTPADVE